MSITALPDPPSRTDPTNFRSRADALLGALPTFVTEANLLALEAQGNADAAQSSAAVAQSAASVTKWVSGTSYTQGQVAWSPVDFQSYRRKVAGAGTTDPSADGANWALLPAERAWAIKSGAYTAVPGDRLQCDTTSAPFTVTAPSSPSAGQSFTVSDYARKFALNNLTVARNGSNVEGVAEDYICDLAGETRTFVFIDATKGWRVY